MIRNAEGEVVASTTVKPAPANKKSKKVAEEEVVEEGSVDSSHNPDNEAYETDEDQDSEVEEAITKVASETKVKKESTGKPRPTLATLPEPEPIEEVPEDHRIGELHKLNRETGTRHILVGKTDLTKEEKKIIADHKKTIGKTSDYDRGFCVVCKKKVSYWCKGCSVIDKRQVGCVYYCEEHHMQHVVDKCTANAKRVFVQSSSSSSA